MITREKLEGLTKEELIEGVLKLQKRKKRFFEDWKKEKKEKDILYKDMCLLKSKYFNMEYSKLNCEKNFYRELDHRTTMEYLLNKMGLVYDLDKKEIVKMPPEEYKKFLEIEKEAEEEISF